MPPEYDILLEPPVGRPICKRCGDRIGKADLDSVDMFDKDEPLWSFHRKCLDRAESASRDEADLKLGMANGDIVFVGQPRRQVGEEYRLLANVGDALVVVEMTLYTVMP